MMKMLLIIKKYHFFFFFLPYTIIVSFIYCKLSNCQFSFIGVQLKLLPYCSRGNLDMSRRETQILTLRKKKKDLIFLFLCSYKEMKMDPRAKKRKSRKTGRFLGILRIKELSVSSSIAFRPLVKATVRENVNQRQPCRMKLINHSA